MVFIGKTMLGDNTYNHELDNCNSLLICEDKEEIVVERMGKIKKVFFSVVDKNNKKIGIDGKFALQDNKVVFLNIIFNSGIDYAEFYEAGNNKPSKMYIVDDEKLYSKAENEFWLVKKADDRKVGIDSEMILLDKIEENKFCKSTDELEKYRKAIVNAFDMFSKSQNSFVKVS